MRQAGKLGRRPLVKRDCLHFWDYFTGNVPKHPLAADHLATLTGWQMLGNDQWGVCNAVTWANTRRLVVFALTGKDIYPTQEQVFEFYKTQNPGFPQEDNGMNVQTGLDYLVSVGGPDGVKALGYAKVDHTRLDQCQAAIAIFGSLWTGIDVLQGNMQQFHDNEPFDDDGSPEEGGHAIITGGYGAGGVGILAGDNKFITWGEEESFTDRYWLNRVEEAWVVIWPEMLGNKEFMASIDLKAFADDYKAITGRDFPVAV